MGSSTAQMPNSFGVRARTRDLFAKRWGTYGMPSMSTYLKTFKRGDIVDIVANPAIHKGFPFKHYQGKTGVIWNVTKTSVGVILNKKVGNRIIKKRIHVRIAHQALQVPSWLPQPGEGERAEA